MGKGATKLDVLKMIYTVAWDKIMYDLKADTSATAAYPKDNNGNVLHQSLEDTSYGVTLKGDTTVGGRFSLGKTLAQMMDIMNAAGLGSDVNIKRADTFTWNNTQINLYSDVDWVFTTLHTPWSTRYIPEKLYKHVDINCDMIVSQLINNDKKYILYHAEIPGDGDLVIPCERSYVRLHSVSYRTINIWMTKEAGSIVTLPNEKTRIILHFRKKPLQTM